MMIGAKWIWTKHSDYTEMILVQVGVEILASAPVQIADK